MPVIQTQSISRAVPNRAVPSNAVPNSTAEVAPTVLERLANIEALLAKHSSRTLSVELIVDMLTDVVDIGPN